MRLTRDLQGLSLCIAMSINHFVDSGKGFVSYNTLASVKFRLDGTISAYDMVRILRRWHRWPTLSLLRSKDHRSKAPRF